MIKLYSYFRSSSSYRVRIALNLKGLEYQIIPVHLVNEGGEQFSDEFQKLNPASRIPVLKDNTNTVAQSVAIIEYLEETHPGPQSLLPKEPLQRALCRQLCEIINSDIQPLQNLSVLKKITKDHGFTEIDKISWIKHWMQLGFRSFESLLQETHGAFCMGDQPGAADCFLVPQVYNAKRFDVDLTPYPTLEAINKKCLEHPAFIKAHPDNQPDTPKI